MSDSLSLGLDVGSTTVKAVVVDGERIVFSDYRRHNADVRGELADDAKEFVRNSPGLAVGLAAAAGFLLARVFRGSND